MQAHTKDRMAISLDEPASGLNRSIEELRGGAQSWSQLTVPERIGLLEALRPRIMEHAREWVEAAVAAKGIDPGSPLAGEEWLSGPYGVLYGVNRYIRTLRSLAKTGRVTLPAGSVRRRGPQLLVRTFPVSAYDKLLFSGISAEAWLPPDVREENLVQNMAAYYRAAEHEPRVALVLGAGNIAAIAPLDVLYKLVADGAVCILKMNPVNAYLAPVHQKIFAPFIERNYLRIVTGDAATGKYLTDHPGIDEIHITGSAQTHDAIVYGGLPKDGPKRLDKPITSELGNVSPTIVLPGKWSRADLRFQAENIVTQKMHNGGFNCIAAQVLILPQDWELADAFVREIENVIRETPARAGYYPGAAQRQATAASESGAREYDEARSGIVPRTLIFADAQTDHPSFTNEAFCSVLTVTRLPGDARAFLDNAVAFTNDRLYGTLGANIIVNPPTERALGDAFEDAVARLRYGSVSINAWTGVAFLLSESTWGAYPGHTASDIQSGTGIVHNTFLFDNAQKTVLRAPFYPFPRSVLNGQLTLLPRPPWFVTNKQAATIAQQLLAFEYAPSPLKIPAIFWSALRG